MEIDKPLIQGTTIVLHGATCRHENDIVQTMRVLLSFVFFLLRIAVFSLWQLYVIREKPVHGIHVLESKFVYVPCFVQERFQSPKGLPDFRVGKAPDGFRDVQMFFSYEPSKLEVSKS